jgi:hypothetical protein
VFYAIMGDTLPVRVPPALLHVFLVMRALGAQLSAHQHLMPVLLAMLAHTLQIFKLLHPRLA